MLQRTEILGHLIALSEAEFELLITELNAPKHVLPGQKSSLGERAVALLELFEGQGQLQNLAVMLKTTLSPHVVTEPVRWVLRPKPNSTGEQRRVFRKLSVYLKSGPRAQKKLKAEVPNTLHKGPGNALQLTKPRVLGLLSQTQPSSRSQTLSFLLRGVILLATISGCTTAVIAVLVVWREPDSAFSLLGGGLLLLLIFVVGGLAVARVAWVDAHREPAFFPQGYSRQPLQLGHTTDPTPSGFDDNPKGRTTTLELEGLEGVIANKNFSQSENKKPNKGAWAEQDWTRNQAERLEEFDGDVILDLNQVPLSDGKSVHSHRKEDDDAFDRPRSGRTSNSFSPTQCSKGEDNWPTGGEDFSNEGFRSGPEYTMAIDLNSLRDGGLDGSYSSPLSASTEYGNQARYEDSQESEKRKGDNGDFDMSRHGGSAAPPKPKNNPRYEDSNDRTMAFEPDAVSEGARLTFGDAPARAPTPPPAQALNATARTMAMDLKMLRKGIANPSARPLTPSSSGMRPLPNGPRELLSQFSANEQAMATDIPAVSSWTMVTTPYENDGEQLGLFVVASPTELAQLMAQLEGEFGKQVWSLVELKKEPGMKDAQGQTTKKIF